eukprot:695876-Amphidinium_carterae.1
MEECIAELAADKENAVAQLTATTQAVVQDVAALKERLEEMQSKALKSMATKEEVERQFGQLKLDKDATIERLSNVTGTLDAAVKDAVRAAMKDVPERELERVKASLKPDNLKELSSPHSAALLQSPPKTIHAFEVFAHLQFRDPPSCGNVDQWPITTVTLVRSCDASSLASAVAPGRQCVTRLLASHGAAGPEQRWEYVTCDGIDNLSHISTHHLTRRKPLPRGSCNFNVYSVKWFQAWLRSSPDEAITNADVRSPKLSN